jgi:hypothetical protein
MQTTYACDDNGCALSAFLSGSHAISYVSSRLSAFSSRVFSVVIATPSAQLWGPSYTTASLVQLTSVFSPSSKLADFRITPGYTMSAINRQYIPLEVIAVGCTLALTSRQSASLDFHNDFHLVAPFQSPGTCRASRLPLQDLFLSLLLRPCTCPCRTSCSLA